MSRFNFIYHVNICTFFGFGKIKKAPGTFGSIAAFPLWIFGNEFLASFNLSQTTTIVIWVILISLLFFPGVWSSNVYAAITGKKDASEIVIDEVVGQLLTILLSYFYAKEFMSSNYQLATYYFLAFVLFRFFDIKKPSIIGYIDKKLGGGIGVMMDDIVAAVFSALVINSIILVVSIF